MGKLDVPKSLIKTVGKFAQKPLKVKEVLGNLQGVCSDFHRMKILSSPFIFKSEKLGLIVKKPYLCGSGDVFRNKHFIPTIPIKIKFNDCYDDHCFTYWFVQPICDHSRKAQDEALRFFENETNLCDKYEDLCELNMGIYEGRAVFFDY